MVGPAEQAAEILASRGVEVTLWDVRCCVPADETMIADAARHCVVVTIEDLCVHPGGGKCFGGLGNAQVHYEGGRVRFPP